MRGELTQALTHLKRALALKPTPEMHYLVGRVYWEQGRRDQALTSQKAVRLDPRFDEAFYSLGLIYWHTNQTSEAREHFRRHTRSPAGFPYRVAIEARAGDVLPHHRRWVGRPHGASQEGRDAFHRALMARPERRLADAVASPKNPRK
jgi:tetratricopeptide (TPR) repeat protein